MDVRVTYMEAVSTSYPDAFNVLNMSPLAHVADRTYSCGLARGYPREGKSERRVKYAVQHQTDRTKGGLMLHPCTLQDGLIHAPVSPSSRTGLKHRNMRCIRGRSR